MSRTGAWTPNVSQPPPCSPHSCLGTAALFYYDMSCEDTTFRSLATNDHPFTLSSGDCHPENFGNMVLFSAISTPLLLSKTPTNPHLTFISHLHPCPYPHVPTPFLAYLTLCLSVCHKSAPSGSWQGLFRAPNTRRYQLSG